MRRHGSSIALLMLLASGATAGQTGMDPEPFGEQTLVRVRPAMLAASIEQLAGQRVLVSGARPVRMFGSRVLVIDAANRLAPTYDHRDRVLVLVERGEIRADPELLVGSTVHVTGVARTLLGMQLAGEVPWPVGLDRQRLERLGVRAAILATSVQTPEGIELTDPSAAAR